MNEIGQNIITAFQNQSWLEMIAVISAIVYLVLVVKENIWCWFFAFISTSIYIYLFYQVVLFSESILNVYYLIMAVYGWWQWRGGQSKQNSTIIRWPLKTHGIIFGSLVILVPLIGYGMYNLGASFPYLDAFVALLAVIATVMVAKKVFENWYYWLLIDSLSIYLFWQKEMYLTALLFIIYIALILVGIENWKNLMAKQASVN